MVEPSGRTSSVLYVRPYMLRRMWEICAVSEPQRAGTAPPGRGGGGPGAGRSDDAAAEVEGSTPRREAQRPHDCSDLKTVHSSPVTFTVVRVGHSGRKRGGMRIAMQAKASKIVILCYFLSIFYLIIVKISRILKIVC